jgi:hypothetical protein
MPDLAVICPAKSETRPAELESQRRSVKLPRRYSAPWFLSFRCLVSKPIESPFLHLIEGQPTRNQRRMAGTSHTVNTPCSKATACWSPSAISRRLRPERYYAMLDETPMAASFDENGLQQSQGGSRAPAISHWRRGSKAGYPGPSSAMILQTTSS